MHNLSDVRHPRAPSQGDYAQVPSGYGVPPKYLEPKEEGDNSRVIQGSTYYQNPRSDEEGESEEESSTSSLSNYPVSEELKGIFRGEGQAMPLGPGAPPA